MITMATVFPSPSDRTTVTEYDLRNEHIVVTSDTLGDHAQWLLTRVEIKELHPEFNDGSVDQFVVVPHGRRLKANGQVIENGHEYAVYNQAFEDEFLAHHKAQR